MSTYDADYEFDLDVDLPDEALRANPEPRCQVAIVLDVSASMAGEPLAALQDGLALLLDEIRNDPLARQRCEIAIITFGGSVKVVQDFATCDNIDLPRLSAQGNTPMGAGIAAGLDALTERRRILRQNGIERYRPWLFLITDGMATDDIAQSARRLREAAEDGRLVCFGVGINDADMERLSEIMPTPPKKLRGLAFSELFAWLSASMRSVSRSQVGEQVRLPAIGWEVV
ncbi:MAG: VWA domain-containing protein [Planctomycetota bacterium]|nr:MAG: VWA domain-containing protein [Planctomycetota bacterium]